MNNENNIKRFDPQDIKFKDGSDDASMLKNFILKIEKLEMQKEALATEVRDIFADAKNEGFETKIMKKILSIRKVKPEKIAEEEMMLEHYKKILGMMCD